jgi:hypothetical protein
VSRSEENSTKLQFEEAVAEFVSSMKEHFKEIEEASAELKQQAGTGVIGIEASKDCWEKIYRDNASQLMQTSSGENEHETFIWKGEVKNAETYAQLSLSPKLT